MIFSRTNSHHQWDQVFFERTGTEIVGLWWWLSPKGETGANVFKCEGWPQSKELLYTILLIDSLLIKGGGLSGKRMAVCKFAVRWNSRDR